MILESVITQTLVVFLFFGTPQTRLQQKDTAELSVGELNAAYLLWMNRYPLAFPRGSTTIRGMPALDLYSPAGVSIYYGEDSRKNADFIRSLPKGIPSDKTGAATSTLGAIRPTLREAIEMVPEFNARKQTQLTNGLYTLFIITFPDWDQCKAQNEAVAEFRRHTRELGVRILEVRLH
jgi:hypothetical protein